MYSSDPDHALLASQPPLAAAFVLRVSNFDDLGRPNLFLVTARHVVDPKWARCAERNPSSVSLRLNRRTGGVGYENIQLETDSRPNFVTSLDPTADLALIPLDAKIIANVDDYKLLEISSGDLLTSSDVPLLRQDLPVRSAGYPGVFVQGQVRYPIHASGSIAEMREEATEVTCGPDSSGTQQGPAAQDRDGRTLRHLWFINTDATAGLIGAPVFIDLERAPGEGSARILLGIQSQIRSHEGVVGITPAYLLRDVLRSALGGKTLARESVQKSLRPDGRSLWKSRKSTRSLRVADE